jgi:hypothetical protein
VGETVIAEPGIPRPERISLKEIGMGYDYTAYFQRLLERVESACAVGFREAEPCEGEMKANDCHRNVDRWVEHHPESKAVRGWLFWPANEAGRYTFMAHSVVKEQGQLFDITPLDANTPRQGLVFLKHLGTEAEFLRMKTTCSNVVFPPFTYDEWRDQPFPEPETLDGADQE